MQKTRYWRWIALALTLFAFLSVILFSRHVESSSCMGIMVVSADELSEYSEKADYDYGDSFLINGEAAPVDRETDTIYISQSIDEDTRFSELYGTLSLAYNDHSLYFEDCEEFKNLKKAVADGKAFKLIVVDPEKRYTEYKVVFTTLPVIRLDGEYSYMNNSNRAVNSGSVCLWSPFDPDYGRYSVKSSATEWNIRGATSSVLSKKPYKLSLKTKKGNNNDVAFLGLGADDDWILNPLSTDDTDVREKMAMSLWNEITAEDGPSARMSRGEYVEVIINGKYSGLYMLQRRIDNKYLELEKNDILFKGLHTWQAEDPRQGYEIEYSSLSEDETFSLLKNFNAELIDLDSFIDASLFIQLGAMHDNKGYNNMFYLLNPDGDGYTLSFIPWDTDLSFGVAYYEWFVYDYDTKLNNLCLRKEYDMMKEAYPELDRLLAERWFELRETTFTRDNIFSLIDSNTDTIISSGAKARDIKSCGTLHGGKDTVESLKSFIEKKIALLDEYYGAFLEGAD